jgi:hypothetical protein
MVGTTMPEPKPEMNRRHTDGDGNDTLRAAHRVIAERAYQLYVEGGRDRSRVADCWRLAKQPWLDCQTMH